MCDLDGGSSSLLHLRLLALFLLLHLPPQLLPVLPFGLLLHLVPVEPLLAELFAGIRVIRVVLILVI